ncbi:small subunit ribosomal protein S1 [Thiohalomonas denitrificans]|uniref:Small subunit ribosomal protein S1 n=2 Tax=Thiohalomonas denitrificans TaxID=415747 RepID=A0A1G5R0V5_9GAMM|nr:small subunit ribosomal protein S1 [Thiohalomonas denitrificans]
MGHPALGAVNVSNTQVEPALLRIHSPSPANGYPMAEHEDFSALLSEFEQQTPLQSSKAPQVGERIRGRIVSIGQEQAFVDVGAKAEAVIDVAELTDAEGQRNAEVGDTIESMVLSRDDRSGTLLLGRGSGRAVHDSAELENAYANQLPVEGLVSGVTKGGLEVQVAGMRGFCPASQADIRFVDDLEAFVGQRLSFRITRFEGGRRPNLVLSRRALLEEAARRDAEELRGRLAVGLVLPGTVTAVKEYGAFVDLGGIEGMVHVSELAYGRVSHPRDVVSPGQAVEVSVLKIEKSEKPGRGERIALSIRALAADPWQGAEQRYPVGTPVKGTVTRLQPFGAFVEVESGLEALVPISELGSGQRVSHPKEVVNPGDAVEAIVLSVDSTRRRLSLSLDASAHEEAANLEAYRPSAQPKADEAVGSFGHLLRESLNKGKSGE